MNWYSKFADNQNISSILDSVRLKKGDQVYVVDPEKPSNIVEYGIVCHVDEDGVWGWWSPDKKEVLTKAKDKDELEHRPSNEIAIGRLPNRYLALITENFSELEGTMREHEFLLQQLGIPIEVTAQSMYNLDIPFPADIGNADSERIWTYENNADNLWWGDSSRKWRDGKEDIIQGLPRYNPEYHDDGIGAFFTWWEPYTEPVMYDSLLNAHRSMNSYFFPGQNSQYEWPARIQNPTSGW